MPLKYTINSLDEVDEGVRGLYEEREGKFVLSVDGVVPSDQVEDVSGLKSALEKERKRAREMESRAKELESKGGAVSEQDLRELEELRAARQKAEEERRRKEGEFDKMIAETRERHEQELAKLRGETQTLRGTLQDSTIARHIASAMAEHGAAVPEALEAYVRQYVKGEVDATGKVGIEVIDTDGMRRLDSDGNPMSIGGFVKALSEDEKFSSMFTSRNRSGGGAGPGDGVGSGGSGGQGGKPKDDAGGRPMSEREKAMAEKREKIAAYKAQKASAG